MSCLSASTRSAARVRSIPVWFVLLAAFSLTGPLPMVRSAITPTGDVDPFDVSTWGGTTTGYIGETAAGTLTVDGGSSLLSDYGYVGYGSAATGLVSVTGPGSNWTNGDSLYVGNSGSGTLSITNSGNVSSPYTCIACNPGSTGLVKVDGAGSALNSNSDLDVGNFGSGMLSIANGAAVSNYNGHIACYSGSSGTVTVDGSGSRWTNNGALFVGGGDSSYYYGGGVGTLSITNGGAVSSANYYIAYAPVHRAPSPWMAPART